MTLEEALQCVKKVEKNPSAQKKISALAMPLGSLGVLEDLVLSLCEITQSTSPSIEKRGVVVFCGDHGVVEEGVSQVGSEVTTAVAGKLCSEETVMCIMARSGKCDVIPVNVGMKESFSHPRLREYSVGLGTENFTKISAMTMEQCEKAIEVGINLAIDLKNEGYQLLVTGEMGIGNTTSSSAITSVMLDCPVETVTGTGAGLSQDGLQRKINAIYQGIKRHKPDKNKPIEVLSTLGGFEIAGMLGLMIGCAVAEIPCVVDGFISNVSALLAVKICPDVQDYLLFSHSSGEQGGKMILEYLKEKPLLQGGFRLGEGSGGVALLPLLDMGLAVLKEGLTFEGLAIEAYEPL